MSVFMIILDCLCWIYVVEILPICRDLEIFMMMYIDLMTCIFWRCMTFIRCDCWGILYMHVIWIWCEDVASISWIFILFACIIALMEIGRYIGLLLFCGRNQYKLICVCSLSLSHTHLCVWYFRCIQTLSRTLDP